MTNKSTTGREMEGQGLNDLWPGRPGFAAHIDLPPDPMSLRDKSIGLLGMRPLDPDPHRRPAPPITPELRAKMASDHPIQAVRIREIAARRGGPAEQPKRDASSGALKTHPTRRGL